MPRRNLHRRRRAQGGCLTFAIAVLVVAALALVAAIYITGRLPAPKTDPVPETVVVVPDSTPGESHLVFSSGSMVESGDEEKRLPTAAPTPTASPSPSPEPTYNPDDPYALVRPQPIGEGFLPIFEKANTKEKQIAITLDECSGASITKEFAQAAVEYGAKLTLFPTGENALRSGMGEVLKTCLFRLGFEIENRCYSGDARLYRLGDYEMASEIWKQSIAVSYALGVNYTPHFLRLYGGDGENDGRTHAYLIQEGYKGVAAWNVNGSANDTETLTRGVNVGNIYFFKTTADDLVKMKALMDEARQQGYQMVTLNELFGYEANEWHDPTENILSATLPVLENPEIPYYFMKPGDCTWAANLMQRRLIELGYLAPDSADGVFGSGTAAALSAFQARAGLAATGAADPESQRRLFADDAIALDVPVTAVPTESPVPEDVAVDATIEPGN